MRDTLYLSDFHVLASAWPQAISLISHEVTKDTKIHEVRVIQDDFVTPSCFRVFVAYCSRNVTAGSINPARNAGNAAAAIAMTDRTAAPPINVIGSRTLTA